MSSGVGPREHDVRLLLTSLARRFPADAHADVLAEVDRTAFYVWLVTSRKGTDGDVCDVGGGIGLFALGCAALGMRSTLVDVDPRRPEDLIAEHSVHLVLADVVEDTVEFEPDSFDAVTCFHTIEHLHHSPKPAFHRFAAALRPGGIFVLGGPNCVNLRKRPTVPLGRGKWSSMES